MPNFKTSLCILRELDVMDELLGIIFQWHYKVVICGHVDATGTNLPSEGAGLGFVVFCS